MLTLFCRTRAPGVPYVEIFRDHADPLQFYILSDCPRIAHDAQTGASLFNYTVFRRSTASARGQLVMTADLAIPDNDLAIIHSYLTTFLDNERAHKSAYNKLFRVETEDNQPRIAYVGPWVNGTVRLILTDDKDVVPRWATTQTTRPSMMGTMTAALSAVFEGEGAWLFRDAIDWEQTLENGEVDSSDPALLASVIYELEGISLVPPLGVRVEIDGSRIYEELRARTATLPSEGRPYWSHAQIETFTRELLGSGAIEINVTDWGIPHADPNVGEIWSQLQQMSESMSANYIATTFFSPLEITKEQGEGRNGVLGIPPAMQHNGKLWLKEYNQEWNSRTRIALEQANNYPFRVAPHGSLRDMLAGEDIDQLIHILDIDIPVVPTLEIPISTDADFETDHISHINVMVSYRQFDTSVNDWIEADQVYLFRSAKDAFVFRTRLARNDRGQPIDLYNVTAEIHYEDPSDVLKIASRDRSDKKLIISAALRREST